MKFTHNGEAQGIQSELTSKMKALEDLAETELAPESILNFHDLGLRLQRLAKKEEDLRGAHSDHHQGAHFFRIALAKYRDIERSIRLAVDDKVDESMKPAQYDEAIEGELRKLWGRDYHQEFNKYGLFQTVEDSLTALLSKR